VSTFTFNTAASIKFGAGMLSQLGQAVREKNCQSALLITDPGMMNTGIVSRAIGVLESAGVEVALFSEVEADPPESVIYAARDLALSQEAHCIVGIGGGSSLDVAKLVAVLALGQENLADMYGVENTKGPRLPLILVPTTAGTGSEVTMVSIVTTGKSEKMGVVSPVILPDIALLDPELTLDLPPHITAATGIDAMVHAIEAYTSVSKNNNPISRQLATQALTLMGASIEQVMLNGKNLAARSDMLLGSMLAGQAFANSPVAAVHALAYPIGGHYKVPHGLSNALVLPHVLRFNAVTASQPYAELAPYAFPEMAGMKSQAAAAMFADKMAALSERCGLETSLREVGIEREALPMLARDAMNQSRLLVNNPREVTERDALAIYESAW